MNYDFNIDKYLEYARNCNGTGHHHHLYLISIFGNNDEVIECSYEEHVELHRILYELASANHSKYLKSITRAYLFIKGWKKASTNYRNNCQKKYNEELKLVNDDLLGKEFTGRELYAIIKPGRKFSNGNNFYDLINKNEFYRMHFIHTNRTHYTYLPSSIPIPGNWIEQEYIDKYKYVIDFDKLLTNYTRISDDDEPLSYRINGYNKYDGITFEFIKDRVREVLF